MSELRFSPNSLLELAAWELFQDRVIWLQDEIDDRSAQECGLLFEALARESESPITLLITSPGGSVYAAMAIYDTMMRIRDTYKVHIVAEARGYAASAAAVIMQAADERLATKNTRLLLHEVSETTDFGEEKYSDQVEKLAELGKVNDMILDILAKRSSHSADEIRNLWRKSEVWMSAKEALVWGLIDQVIGE